MLNLNSRTLSRSSRQFLLASGALVIATSSLPAQAAPAGGKPLEAGSRRGAAAYLLPDCPTQQDQVVEGAFIAVAASFAADFIIGAVEKWLAKRRAELSGEFMAATSTPRIFSPPNAGEAPQLSFGCLVIASGEFGKKRTDIAETRVDLTTGDIGGLGLADYPNFYLEARAVAVGNAVTLAPVYLDYRDLAAAERSRKRTKKVVAIVGFSAKSLAKDAAINEESAFAVYRFNLGELEVGKVYKGNEIFTGLSAVQTMPSPIVNGNYEPKAANVVALVAETEDPSLALELLTSAFASNKDALNKAIEDAVKKALGENAASEGS